MARSREEINRIIKEAWTNQSRGFGSKKSLLRDAKQMEPEIKANDVNEWWDKNRERKNKMYAYNSFVPPHPLYELQVDLFHYKYKQKQNEGKNKFEKDAPYGIIAVDPFTKYIWVEPADRAKKEWWAHAMEKIFHKMGLPKVVY